MNPAWTLGTLIQWSPYLRPLSPAGTPLIRPQFFVNKQFYDVLNFSIALYGHTFCEQTVLGCVIFLHRQGATLLYGHNFCEQTLYDVLNLSLTSSHPSYTYSTSFPRGWPHKATGGPLYMHCTSPLTVAGRTWTG